MTCSYRRGWFFIGNGDDNDPWNDGTATRWYWGGSQPIPTRQELQYLPSLPNGRCRITKVWLLSDLNGGPNIYTLTAMMEFRQAPVGGNPQRWQVPLCNQRPTDVDMVVDVNLPLQARLWSGIENDVYGSLFFFVEDFDNA